MPMVRSILCLVLFIIVDTESFVTRLFSVRQTKTTACSQKREKDTPEAQELRKVLQEKESGTSPYKLIIAQTAPSVRIAFSEVFGHEPGAFKADLLVASLKSIGFDLVLDTNTGADLTICEEGHELLKRILDKEQDDKERALPLFTSCCPGWMKFVEKSAPEVIPYLSTCKSPHMMYGAVVKRFSKELLGCEPHEIYLCSVMPCLLKRGESDALVFTHDEVRDVDNVITTRDLGIMLKERGVDPLQLEPQQYDSPFQSEKASGSGLGSGSGQLFGATGGVMEAAVRSVYEFVTGCQLPRLELTEVRGLEGVKEATISLFNNETGDGLDNIYLKLAVVSGLGNAKKLLTKIQSGNVTYDFVEVMACPGGCINGGGQPRSQDKDNIQKRLDCIYSLDKELPIRRSHENPVVKALYEKHLGQGFGSPTAKEVLHVQQVYGEPEQVHDSISFGCDPECND
jgi:iron-only hydrogenase group A